MTKMEVQPTNTGAGYVIDGLVGVSDICYFPSLENGMMIPPRVQDG